LSRRLSTAAILAGGQILPEERVVDVTAAVEVDQWLQGHLGSDILLGHGGLQLLGGGVEAVDVGLMVVLVVKFHNLARDRRLEGAIIIYQFGHHQILLLLSFPSPLLFFSFPPQLPHLSIDSHGRSGSVALPRTKLVLAIVAAFFAAPARRAERAAAADDRKRVADMIEADGEEI
jgi:hypothetical protein